MNETILLGDIGGTNSRFALVQRGAVVPEAVRYYRNAEFPTLADAVRAYLAAVDRRADSGVLAIAGPVAGEIVGPTNLARWRFRPPELRGELGLQRLDVINDFEAVAYALPHLAADETETIGPVEAGVANANMAVLGPGTGLGVGALVRAGGRWSAVPSEGGHTEIGAPLGAWAKAHAAILADVGRVSGEHVLSGSGLERIDAALRGGTARRSAAEIGSLALSGSDASAREAASLFFDYLARFSGDVALMFAAKGGVFLYGGVAQKLSALLDPVVFRAGFEAKSPLEPFLQVIPTKLITAPCPGLAGCAAVAADW
jgi:glucokinase